jgi:uncharacterized protein YegJ (DUF2314 family)
VRGNPGEHEHIWLTDVWYGGDGFRAKVGNVPQKVEDVRFGEEVTVGIEDVTDWMIVEDGVLLGGYTVRVLRSRMTDQEKDEFDRNAGVVIPD